MSETIEGGCRCGRVRYCLNIQHLPKAYACHCRDCQTWSGSAFSLNFVLPEDQLVVTGEPAIFELLSPDGERISRQRACPVCFTRLFNTNTARPGMVGIRAGTLDRSDELVIGAHIWTKRKLAGLELPEGTPAWLEGAPPAEFIAALAR